MYLNGPSMDRSLLRRSAAEIVSRTSNSREFNRSSIHLFPAWNRHEPSPRARIVGPRKYAGSFFPGSRVALHFFGSSRISSETRSPCFPIPINVPVISIFSSLARTSSESLSMGSTRQAGSVRAGRSRTVTPSGPCSDPDAPPSSSLCASRRIADEGLPIAISSLALYSRRCIFTATSVSAVQTMAALPRSSRAKCTLSVYPSKSASLPCMRQASTWRESPEPKYQPAGGKYPPFRPWLWLPSHSSQHPETQATAPQPARQHVG